MGSLECSEYESQQPKHHPYEHVLLAAFSVHCGRITQERVRGQKEAKVTDYDQRYVVVGDQAEHKR